MRILWHTDRPAKQIHCVASVGISCREQDRFRLVRGVAIKEMSDRHFASVCFIGLL